MWRRCMQRLFYSPLFPQKKRDATNRVSVEKQFRYYLNFAPTSFS